MSILSVQYVLLCHQWWSIAVTGNESVGFAEEDFTDDFDPDSYDKRMSKVFGDDYYGQDETEKPVFPSDEGILQNTYLIIQNLSEKILANHKRFAKKFYTNFSTLKNQ